MTKYGTIESDILKEIVASPEDLGLRGIYADWLRQNAILQNCGDPRWARGVLISAMCNSKTLSLEHTLEKAGISLVEAAQIELHIKQWESQLRRQLGDRNASFTWENGFPQGITISRMKALKGVVALAEANPVHTLSYTGSDELDRTTPSSLLGELQRLRKINFTDSHDVGDFILPPIANLTKNLQSLLLGNTQVSDDGLKHLVNLEALTTLELPPQIGVQGLRTLAESSKLNDTLAINSEAFCGSLGQFRWQHNIRPVVADPSAEASTPRPRRSPVKPRDISPDGVREDRTGFGGRGTGADT